MPSFRATRYVRPLSEPLPLAPGLGFFFDNPREAAEIEMLEAFLRETLRFPHVSDDENAALWNAALDEFFSDPSVTQPASRSADPIVTIARMGVVARFADEGASAELRKIRDEFDPSNGPGFVLLEDDHPFVKNDKALAAFCALISLLVHSEAGDYFGATFIYNDSWLDHPRDAARAIVLSDISAQLYHTRGVTTEIGHPEDAWHFYPLVIDSMLGTGARLESAYAKGEGELLRFVGDLLVSAQQATHDPKLRILVLVSILELLVTRNPATERFNVEDSISRQFVLKVGVIASLEEYPRPDLQVLRKRLRTIYSRRSAIAHGALAQTSPGQAAARQADEDLVSELYGLVRCVLKRFVDDADFVRFLKDG